MSTNIFAAFFKSILTPHLLNLLRMQALLYIDAERNYNRLEKMFLKKYEQYLLVSDLDGTLIRTDKTISHKNKQAIHDFVLQGGHFTIATGRTVQNVVPYLDGLSINESCILYNGAAIYNFDGRRLVECHLLKKNKMISSIEWFLEHYSNLCIQVYTPKTLYIINHNQRVDPVILKEKQPYEFADLNSISHKDWIKIILNGSPEELLMCNAYLNDTTEENSIHTVFSVPTYLEVLPFGVSKGAALCELINYAEYRYKKVITIGDYDNDIEMLKMADLGIAPENASEGAKKAADLLTVSNDNDAIFEVINHVLPHL